MFLSSRQRFSDGILWKVVLLLLTGVLAWQYFYNRSLSIKYHQKTFAWKRET